MNKNVVSLFSEAGGQEGWIKALNWQGLILFGQMNLTQLYGELLSITSPTQHWIKGMLEMYR